MKEGAFALIDCLGFKGLWQKDHGALMTKIRSINSTVNTAMQAKLQAVGITINPQEYQYEVKLLSDSVAISVHRADKASKFSELVVIGNIVRALTQLYFEGEPHLLLRGCITYGKYTSDENFIVGPAVDATAEFMNCAEGAFIWYLPPAAKIINEFHEVPSRMQLIVKSIDAFFPQYSIPIKGSHFLESRVINPIYRKNTEDALAIIEIFKTVMDKDNMSIWMKRQYTLSFLRHCQDLNAALEKETVVG